MQWKVSRLKRVCSVVAALATFSPACGMAQKAADLYASNGLPSAPSALIDQQAIQGAQTQPPTPTPGGAPQTPSPQVQPGTPAQPAGTPAPGAQTLTLQQAQAMALKNNPQISAARLIALASQQVTREVRSNYWPTAIANVTGVDAEPGTRITAGGLNNPLIYERAAAGATVSQLITDFGRTANLVASANLTAQAEDQNAVATKEQILLAVNQAFYSALQTQAVLQVAQQTVNARQIVTDQVNALFESKLKSELDLSFAKVNLSQAQLLLLDAGNNHNAALATLSMVVGYPNLQNFELVDTAQTPNAPPPGNVDDLIATAFSSRPEILALQLQAQSEEKFRIAERDLMLPSIRALGAIGDTPYGNPAVASKWYGAVGGNLEIPIFNGFLYTARAHEARLRAQAANERLRDMRDRISRDVRASWLNANTAYQRLSVTQQLLQQANLGLDLANTRYKMGLGSIVELSQAQLQQTQAQIAYVQAGYDYRFALDTLTYETKGI